MEKKLPRWWLYPRGTWRPHWWNKIGWPFFGADEYGRLNVVIGFWFTGYLVLVTSVCQCEDCVDLRTFTLLKEHYGEDFADDWLNYQNRIRLQGVSGSGTRRV